MTSEELTDEITQAISDSFDMDWNATDGARAVVANVPVVGAIPDLIAALYQYRSDLIYPPAPDSCERRVAMIADIIDKIGAA